MENTKFESSKILRLILGDQLNENHSWFKKPDRTVAYVMIKVRQETDYVVHHIQSGEKRQILNESAAYLKDRNRL